MANSEVQVINLVEDTPPPPPPPALKKRATKRGLSKLAADVPDDPPEVEFHNTNVYSSCVQRSAFLLPNRLRKPLFSKQSDNTDSKESDSTDEPLISDEPNNVSETGRPQRKHKTHAASTAPVELNPATIELDDDLDEDENSALTTDEVSIIRSPSPPVPPPPPARLHPKRKRVSKGIRNAFKAIDSMKGELQKVLTSPQTPPVIFVDSPEQNNTQVVRVRHIEDIHRFSMSKTEMFYNLQTHMAHLLGVHTDQIGLYLNDSRLGSSDTPLSKRLHVADIIVCHVLVNKEGGSEEEEVTNTDDIRVQMQCQNSRQKSSMIIKKFLPFRVMMEKYAEKKGKPLEKFRFHFDGEQLQPDMLPNEMELDNDDTIDVVEMK